MVKTLPALLILVLTGLSGAFSHTLSQTDTEFWFVAPEVWAGHGDFPILLRFATFDEAAVITVEQPANPNFPTQTLNVDANSIYSLDLTTWLSQIENKPANSILNFGFHITSNSPITAYYEVNRYNNPDIFTLKGSNALGLDFVVPFQMFLNNGYTQSTSSFDIVATEDGTVVTITPQKPIIGHPANVTFSITLNEGQTWSGRATSVSADQHPSGTTVTSNKPIAITMSDDSVNGTPYGGCADIMGDQIVPVNLLGTEYIAIKGNLNGPDKVFIVTTEPGTTVSVNGNLETTLPAASSMYTHTLTEPSAYYTTNHPVYVLHLTGFGCEIGGALLPPIVCTGSQEVAFVRSTSEFIGLKILVPSGGEGDFTFNGNTTNIMADDFSNVPGTEGLWKFANITATSFVPTLQASRLTNSTANFHLGIIHGGASSGTRYGYFSNYAAQAYVIEVSDNTLCEGQELDLAANTLIGASYNWTGPNGFTGQGNPFGFGEVDTTNVGEYIVSGFVGSCPIENDTLDLFVYPIPEQPAIFGDLWLCEGDELTLSTDTLEAVTYQWMGPSGSLPNSSTVVVEATTVEDSGNYSLSINDNGCFSPVSNYSVSIVESMSAQIDSDSLVACAGESVLVQSLNNSSSLLTWLDPFGNNLGNEMGFALINSQTDETGWYQLTGIADGCALGPDSVWIEIIAQPEITSLTAPPVCIGNEAVLTATTNIPDCSFIWYNADGDSIGSGNPLLIENASIDDIQTYACLAEFWTCSSSIEMVPLDVVAQLQLSITNVAGNEVNEISLCSGEGFTINAEGASEIDWQWNIPGGNTSSSNEWSESNAQESASGWYTLNGYIGNCPMLSDSVYVTILPTPEIPDISALDPMCEGSNLSLTATTNLGASIIWNQDFWGTWEGLNWEIMDIPLEGEGMYSAYALINGCASASSSEYLEVVPLPEIELNDFGTVTVFRCPEGYAVMHLPEYDPAYSTSWTFTDVDGNTIDFESGSMIETNEDGIYHVILETGLPCNLEASGTFEVEMIACEMIIPNIFSPNKDGHNDSFYIPYLSYFPGSTCSIFNRWGNVVYESSNFGNSAGWEPTIEEAAEGTYYYVILINRDSDILLIEDQFGAREISGAGPVQFTGSLTLVR